jgi:hypothetical protein
VLFSLEINLVHSEGFLAQTEIIKRISRCNGYLLAAVYCFKLRFLGIVNFVTGNHTFYFIALSVCAFA